MNPWITVIVSVLFGGAAGAFINNYISYRRGKKQPIAYNISLISVFKSLQLPGKHETNITMSGTNENADFSLKNLYIASIELTNIGNKDFDAFTFQASVTNAALIIAIGESTQGTQHETHYSPIIAPDSPTDKVTIKCDPFNRKDSYTLNLYLTNDEVDDVSIDKIKIDTKHAVNFTASKESQVLNRGAMVNIVVSVIMVTGFIWFMVWDTTSSQKKLRQSQQRLDSIIQEGKKVQERQIKKLEEYNAELDSLVKMKK